MMMDTSKNFDICNHCSNPFQSNPWERDKCENVSLSPDFLFPNNDTLNFNSSSSVIDKLSVDRVLSKIFKLDYLKFIHPSSSDVQKENDGNYILCLNCVTSLTHLYQLYNDFLKLGQLNSSINRQVNKLNEIIDEQTTVQRKESETQTPHVSIFFEGKPQIVLTRLEENSARHRKRRPVKYQNSFDLDSDVDMIYNDSLSPPVHTVEDDDTLPVNYLDINIKVEEKDWEEPRHHHLPRLKGSKKGKKSSTKKKLVTENPKLDVDLRDYLSRRTKYPNPCWYCKSWNFASPADCLQHTIEEHLPQFKNDEASVCQRCSKICLNEKSMSIHQKRCELIPMGEILAKPFTCTEAECTKSFASKKLLSSHLKSHSVEKPFSCEEHGCSFKARTLSVLNTHKKFQHPVEPEDSLRVQCNDCGTWVKNVKCLYSHRFKMHTSKGFTKYKELQKISLAKRRQRTCEKNAEASSFCSHCSIDFCTPYGLTMHRKNFHPQDVEKRFVCELCGQSLRSASALRIHLRVHSDERPYLCQQCGKGFKHNSNLKDHAEQVHTEEGRLKYNEHMRAKVRRRKLLQSQLAQRQLHVNLPTTHQNQ